MAKTNRRCGADSARWATVLVVVAAMLSSAAARAQPTEQEATPEEDTAPDPDAAPAPEEAAEDSAAADEGVQLESEQADCSPPCRPGYSCVDGQCVSACNPPCAVGEICTATLQCVPDREAEPPPGFAVEKMEHDRDRELIGVRGFGGIVLGGGASMHSWRAASGDRLTRPSTWGAFLFALRAGLFVDRNEVSIEWAPGTYRPVIGGEEDALDNDQGLTSFIGSYAHHIRMTRSAYWPLRFGAGFVHRSHGRDPALDGTHFQGRIDLLNISVKTKVILLDFSFPSVRYLSDFDAYHRWTGLFTAAVSIISP